MASGSDLHPKEEVRSFWEAGPCGAKHASSPVGTAAFFEEVERAREQLEPFIAGFARFDATAGRDVLEIGVGLGTDLIRFARAGARVTGVDLTETSIELVRRRCELEGLTATLEVADAERLPFPDDSFDLVYSWGVLHHTPDTARAVAEAIRVGRPGGRICVMLYARRSWVALALWVRYALLAGRPARSVRDVVADHMESVGTKAFTQREVRAMFGSLDELTIRHQCTPYDRRVAGWLAGLTGGMLGWFVVIQGTKPQ